MTDTGTSTERETRTCSKCGQTDSDPHHVQYVAFVHPVTGEPVDLSISKHLDCCSEDGCEICGADVARATADGVSVRDFAMAPSPSDHLQMLFEVHGVETPEFQTTAETTAEEA